MKTPECLHWGNGRRGIAALFVSTICTGLMMTSVSALAQDEPNAAPSVSPRLPGDQPGANPSPAAAAKPVAAASAGAASNADQMQQMMSQMMEMSKLNENHKLLASLDGTWDYTVKMWMDGNTSGTPQVSKGVATRKAIMDGRFVMMDVNGKMQMPGPDGKPKEMAFKGHGMEGYDNVKKKFVGTWMDNMGTGIMTSEGDYDVASKTFTYTGEFEMMPGMKQKIREVLKLTDKDHMLFEWYEDRGGKEAKTMEIAYTKRKS